MNFTGTSDRVTVTWSTSYAVEISDPVDPTFNPATISPYDVLTAPGLPIVNRSTYVVGANILPFVICRKKSARQSEQRASRWIVSAEFTAYNESTNDEANNQPQPLPESLSDLSPQEVPTLGEVERVLYFDQSDQDNGGNLPSGRPVITPTGHLYDEPLIEKVPTLEIKLAQYESSITYEEMLRRKNKCNETTYRGHGRYKWMIKEVEATEVVVQLRSGPVEAALVTHTICFSPRENGWAEERLLIDTHYLDGAGDKVLFIDKELGSTYAGNINEDGTRRDALIPLATYFEAQGTIAFGDFLQA